MNISIQALNATNSQSVSAMMNYGAAGNANKGLGAIANSNGFGHAMLGGTAGGYGATAADTTTTGYMQVTFKWSDANVGEDIVLDSGYMELLP